MFSRGQTLESRLRRLAFFRSEDGRSGSPVVLSQAFAESYEDQAQSPLFSVIPGEIRDRIFAHALLEYENKTKPFARDGYVSRPGFRYAGRIDTNLLATCRLVYLETHLLPVSSNEHVFWHHPSRGPRSDVMKIKPEMVYFKQFTDEQCNAVERVRLFMQMFALEREFEGICKTPRMTPKVVTVIVRHTDWWFWESNNPLKLEEDWIRHLKLISSLEKFELELETMERDKNQLAAIADRVKRVRISTSNNQTLTTAGNPPEWSKWNGPSGFEGTLKYNSERGQWMRHSHRSPFNKEEVVDKMVYHVVKLTWTIE